MNPPSFCNSCCASCFLHKPPLSVSNSPYALHNLLAFGTITINFPVAIEHQICTHTHAEDGWHHFQAKLVIPHLLDMEEIAFCRGLEYLVKERFIAATCHSNHIGFMDVRIYLVPYDLPNTQGKLRMRKENIMAPGKRYMRTLLPKVSRDVERWNGRKSTEVITPVTPDPRTLPEIYSDLPSPNAVPISGYGEITSRLMDFDDDLDGLEMRSNLYGYQRRSVAAMLQKELDLRDVPDPLYITLTTVEDEPFYIQPGTMEVLLERPMSATCRGGILCEELGTGKTIMMLSLIVATRKQISSPEPSFIDDRPFLTPAAYRLFPSSEFATARKRTGVPMQENPRVPSLVELMLHRARTNPFCDIPKNSWSQRYHRNLAKEDELSTLPLGRLLAANTPFYHHYLGEPNNRERTQRSKLPQAPRTVYLTSATLIVVPANLISQWDREILKHCAVPLRVLILRTKTPIPNVQSLASDYDIILMSYERFSAESSKDDIMKLHAQKVCKCPSFEGSRVPNCTCNIAGVSPFLQIRWKRLVIDEGHVSSRQTSNLVSFAKMISVERRWIVTGTPTTNLLGLSFGNKSVVDEEPENPLDNDSSAIGDLSTLSSISASPAPTPIPLVKQRTWNKYDREDLKKLGSMITHFIAVPQFSADSKLVATHIIEPLLDPAGPRAGAIQVLNQVMNMVMIRHRIDDVERDVILPPVKQEAVLLDLDPYVIKSFNALQAGIVINALDSERKDQDYMFHPSNADVLQETVKNMSQILFWHVTDELYNAEQLVKDTDKYLERAKERGMPEQDIIAAEEAFEHLRLALNDPVWKNIQKHEDVPYRVYNLDEEVFKAWTRIPYRESNTATEPHFSGLLQADMLLRMYELLLSRPLTKHHNMIEVGNAVMQRDKALRLAYEESQRRKGKNRKKAKSGDDSGSSQIVEKFAKKACSADTVNEMQKELDATLARLEQEEAEETGSAVFPDPSRLQGSTSKRPSNLLASSPFAKIRIGSSASTKLNYIINEVAQYSAAEKFLIFSESPLSLAHVAEALQLIHVKFLQFTTQVSPRIREEMVLTFETSETYRVFLMELKHGARGLNLVSASRVIFCEPVWQADVESQAIKRAHRIGQTRPITVKTLAIRQTAEENMVARRTALKDSQEKLPKVLEEAGMRHYIANPKFITDTPQPTPIAEFPLVDLPPELLQPRPNAIVLRVPALPNSPSTPKRVRVEAEAIGADSGSPMEGDDSERHTPKKKARTIRFDTP